MQGKGILEQMTPVDPAADPAALDETPQHEGAESPEMEGQEGSEDGDLELDPETDPAYAKAIDLVMGKLYDENISDGIATAIGHADDKVKAIVEQASTLLGIADDMTQGSVPDELYMSFAIEMLTEVVEIAQAAGTPIAGREIAQAARAFIERTVEDLGGDLTEVKAAMDEINPEELGASLDQVGD